MRPDVFHLIFTYGQARHPYTGPWTDMKWREDLLNMVESVPMRKPHPKRKFEARVGHLAELEFAAVERVGHLDELAFAAVENPMRPKHDVDDIIMRCLHKRQTITYEPQIAKEIIHKIKDNRARKKGQRQHAAKGQKMQVRGRHIWATKKAIAGRTLTRLKGKAKANSSP